MGIKIFIVINTLINLGIILEEMFLVAMIMANDVVIRVIEEVIMEEVLVMVE